MIRTREKFSKTRKTDDANTAVDMFYLCATYKGDDAFSESACFHVPSTLVIPRSFIKYEQDLQISLV